MSTYINNTYVYGFSIANADQSMAKFIEYCNNLSKNDKVIILKESLDLRKLSIEGRYFKIKQRANKEYRIQKGKTHLLIEKLNKLGISNIEVEEIETRWSEVNIDVINYLGKNVDTHIRKFVNDFIDKNPLITKDKTITKDRFPYLYLYYANEIYLMKNLFHNKNYSYCHYDKNSNDFTFFELLDEKQIKYVNLND